MASYHDLFPEEEQKLLGESRMLLLTLPSVTKVGEEITLKASMLSVSGFPDENFAGRVELTSSSPCLEAPDRIEFSQTDHGLLRVPGLEVSEPGVYFLEARVEGSPSQPVRTNPTKALHDPALRLYWGDIHFHTVFGNCHPDCAKHPSFGYWYARNVSHLDFASATDHLRGLNSKRWAETKRVNERHNVEDEFVTLLGFESSHSKEYGGDINVYYRDGEADYFWIDREDMRGTTPKVGLDVLWKWLDQQGKAYLTIPHHTGRAAKYRDFSLPYYYPESEPVLEIFSMWGSSEARHDDFFLRGGKTDEKAYLQDALGLGYKYGVIGSSDTHHTMPGTPFSVLPTPYHVPANSMVNQGLAAVYAPRLSRAHIFDALVERRCYATTFTRPILDLDINGEQMGGTLALSGSIPRQITVDLSTSLLPATVEILRNNRIIHEVKAEEPHLMHRFTDEVDPDGLWISRSPKNKKPFFHYYVRVRYSGRYTGVTAWSSPIWVEREH